MAGVDGLDLRSEGGDAEGLKVTFETHRFCRSKYMGMSENTENEVYPQ